MTFEEALREWGARRLEAKNARLNSFIDRASVVVDLRAEVTSSCDTCGTQSEVVLDIQGTSTQGVARFMQVDDIGMGLLIRELDAIASEVPR
jgi:hypothetical protein